MATLALLALAACRVELDGENSIFYDGDARTMHCAVNLDIATGSAVGIRNVLAGLDRAQQRGEIIELFAHRPGITVGWAALEAVIAGAAQRDLRFFTYAELLQQPRQAGIALSFDDAAIDTWYEARTLFQRYGARATFFVTRYAEWSDRERGLLRELANEGHGVEPHGRFHLNSPQYVEERGLRAYMRDEVMPSIDALLGDGYQPTTYAYPFGARTSETDEAILDVLPKVRSVTFSFDGPLAYHPCPR